MPGKFPHFKIFDVFQLIFVACPFGAISKKSLPNLMSQNFPPMFSSNRFIVFTFRSFIHFRLIFVYIFRKGSNFILKNFFFLIILAVLHSMKDLSSLTRDQTQPPALEARSINHWTAREVPQLNSFPCGYPSSFPNSIH